MTGEGVIGWLGVAGTALLLLVLLLQWRFRLPAPREAGRTEPARQGRSGPLHDVVHALLARAPGRLPAASRNAVLPLAEPLDALAVRIQLIRMASYSLDLQYYIWHADVSGRLLLNELLAAAARGVRVRLLLDDNGIAGMDTLLAEIDRQPNMEVRIFNPFPVRRPKFFSWLIAPRLLNRRMHNKSFTADGLVALVGGRNVGDEYFGMSEGSLFADLDAMVAGDVVPAVVEDFGKYWDSSASYRVAALVAPARQRRRWHLRRLVGQDGLAARYLQHLAAVPSLSERFAGNSVLWAPVEMVGDTPAKITGNAPQERLLFSRLIELMGRPAVSFDLVSAYFVPGKEGVRRLATLAREGVRVRILTNSFEATDVAIVHCGYLPARKALLEAGVSLFELKGRGKGAHRRKHLFSLGGSLKGKATGMAPRSRISALHAKTFAVDGRRVFVGSFNFDPRSIALNTELGFVIDSAELAEHLAEVFRHRLKDWAYRVGLTRRGTLFWEEWSEEGQRQLHRKLHRREPGTTMASRLLVRGASLLPILWLL